MSIQSDINQTLSLASLLYTQSPAVKAKVDELRRRQIASKRSEILEAQRDIIRSDIDVQRESIPKKGRPGRKKAEVLQGISQSYQDLENVGKGIENINRQRFDIDPTPETYQALKMSQAMTQAYRSESTAARMKADKILESLKAAKKETKERSLITKMSDVPTSLGETLGSLPKHLRDKIIGTYAEQERMNLNGKK